jgi:hypothetical protein
VTIYVVYGEQGIYEDYGKWIVKAFIDEKKAKELVLNANIVSESEEPDTDYRETYSYEPLELEE